MLWAPLTDALNFVIQCRWRLSSFPLSKPPKDSQWVGHLQQLGTCPKPMALCAGFRAPFHAAPLAAFVAAPEADSMRASERTMVCAGGTEQHHKWEQDVTELAGCDVRGPLGERLIKLKFFMPL